MKKESGYLKGSFLVETAALFPAVFLVLLVSIYLTFYYHDKIILTGAVNETASAGSEWMRLLEKPQEEKLEQFCQERLRGKMIFFGTARVQVKLEGTKVTVEADAWRKLMYVHTAGSMAVTEPEQYLRSMKRLQEAVK